MYTFQVFIRYVTGQERGDRALKDFKAYLVEDIILGQPNAPRPQIEEDAEQWAQAIIDKQQHELIDACYAGAVRQQFRQFKKEYKSRKASAAGKIGAKKKRKAKLKADRKTDKRSVEKLEKLVRFVEREQGREIARTLIRNEIEQGVDDDGT
jgi:hypothetical protein